MEEYRREGNEGGRGVVETLQGDGARRIYAVGCRRRVDRELRSINNDTTALHHHHRDELPVSFSYPVLFELNNLEKMDLP